MACCLTAPSHLPAHMLSMAIINRFCGIHIRVIFQEILKISICKMSLKISFIKYYHIFQGPICCEPNGTCVHHIPYTTPELVFTKSPNRKGLEKGYKGLETFDVSSPILRCVLGQLWWYFQISGKWDLKSQQHSDNPALYVSIQILIPPSLFYQSTHPILFLDTSRLRRWARYSPIRSNFSGDFMAKNVSLSMLLFTSPSWKWKWSAM